MEYRNIQRNLNWKPWSKLCSSNFSGLKIILWGCKGASHNSVLTVQTVLFISTVVLRRIQFFTNTNFMADYLDLTFIIDSRGKLSTRLYDKLDDFDFHIVNFPYLSSNLPSGPSYGVYISQLIRYARCCSHYDDFRYRHKCLVDRLLSQGYIALRLQKSFKKFYGRYQDLIEKYQRSVNVMVNDSFPG